VRYAGDAAKADFISLTAFEVGLFGWMAIMAGDPRGRPSSSTSR